MNYCRVDGVRLAYRIDGADDAPALVMINSLGTNLSMWNPQIALLSHKFRIVRYDCRGHGASDVPPSPYSIERFGRDVLALLDTLAIKRVHLCGLSLGGMVAQWIAYTHPERVDHVIFANTAARIGTVESWNTRIEAVRTGGMAAIQETVLGRFLSEEFRCTHPEETEQIRQMIVTTNPEGYIGACIALRDADLREQIRAIGVPTLIMSSTKDESTPPSQSEEMHAAIQGSKLVILPEAAHLSNVEQAEAFTHTLLSFLTHG